MGALSRIFLAALFLGISLVYINYRDMAAPLPIPELDHSEYWGPGLKSNYKEDTSIRPFSVKISEDVINKLQQQIESSGPFTAPLEGAAFEYGFNTIELPKVIDYWKNNYLKNWSKREAYLNSFPQFKTTIQGLDIHYIHAKPKTTGNVKVYPIILLHGWPGSVREFYEMIPKLIAKSDDKDFVFEVIVPSLPGYGWSQGSSKKGLGTVGIAVIMNNLMQRLGFNQYFVQGGDWGSKIGSNIATLYPSNVIGYHSNFCACSGAIATIKGVIASFAPSYFVENKKYVDWYYPYMPKFMNMITESGYMHIQATKPDTIGIALNNNPVGLAAYILEKFSTWTNMAYRDLPDGGLTKYFTMDSLLDNVMIYYLSDSITTSFRLYYEAFSAKEFGMDLDRIPIIPPSSCSKFRNELMMQIDWILKDKFTNLVQVTYHEDGGHFAAMQLSDVLYRDVISFVKKVKTTL